MKEEDFIYLFGGTGHPPVSYNPPYYWTGEESIMKALLKVLYKRQPRALKNLILSDEDKINGETSHDWSRNKTSISNDIRDEVEEYIIQAVEKVCGAKLKPL